ncbi:MAG: hypothetical protein RSB38_05225 [Oscillospiraceae bacterium]
MFFFGQTFAGGLYSLDAAPSCTKEITEVQISNSISDEIYMTSQPLNYSTSIPTTWDFDTILHAKFNNNLLAGNVEFAVGEVSKLRLKRRKRESVKWDILLEQPVSTIKDLHIEWEDRTARANTSYEYAIVPMFGDVEGSFFASDITTDFRGLFIMDRDNTFATELDVKITEQREKPRAVIKTINRKYPFVISNGKNDNNAGSLSAQFLEYYPESDDWNVDGVRLYLDNLKDFLNNGTMKLIKYEDGRMWLIDLSSPSITDTEDGMQAMVHTSFDWVEIGDCDDSSDLYLCNFIDVDSR